MKRYNKTVIVLAIVCIVILSLSIISTHPILQNSTDAPEDMVDAAYAEAKGVYSNWLPLVPLYVTIEWYTEDKIYYTIQYLPAGTVEMVYSKIDGYSIEKALTGL